MAQKISPFASSLPTFRDAGGRQTTGYGSPDVPSPAREGATYLCTSIGQSSAKKVSSIAFPNPRAIDDPSTPSSCCRATASWYLGVTSDPAAKATATATANGEHIHVRKV